MSADPEALRPCPFCGGSDHVECPNVVGCAQCGAGGPTEGRREKMDPDLARAAWNRRTPAPGVEREDVASAIHSLEATGRYWVVAKGRTRPDEPLYGVQIMDGETSQVDVEAEADTLAEAVSDALAMTGHEFLAMLPQKEGWRPTHRHVKRGTDYQFIDEADLQTDKPLADYAVVAVYRGSDGRLWVRPASEFNDGRFAPISPAHEGGEA